MTAKNTIKLFPIDSSALFKRIAIGAGLGFAIMSLFLSGVHDPNPEWGKFWMIRPLIVQPMAGALGGAVTYFVSKQEFRSSSIRKLAIVGSWIVLLIGLYLGFVLGLDGTLWD